MRSSRPTRRAGVGGAVCVAASVAAALLLGACSGSSGGGGTTPPPPQPLPTKKGQSADAQDLSQRVNAAVVAAGSAAYTLTSNTADGADGSGVATFGSKGSSISLTLPDGSHSLQVVSVPGAFYANVGQPVGGKAWLRITPGATDQISSTIAPLLGFLTGSADVTAQVNSWVQANEFVVQGPATVDGVATTEYEATIPQDAVTAGLSAQFRDLMQASVTGDSDLRVWLDGQGRPIRVVTDGNVNNQPSRIRVDYRKWGSGGTVTVPPSSDVTTPPSS